MKGKWQSDSCKDLSHETFRILNDSVKLQDNEDLQKHENIKFWSQPGMTEKIKTNHETEFPVKKK